MDHILLCMLTRPKTFCSVEDLPTLRLVFFENKQAKPLEIIRFEVQVELRWRRKSSRGLQCLLDEQTSDHCVF